jgi:hypothetical protein
LRLEDPQETRLADVHSTSALAYKEIRKNGEFVLPVFGKLVKQKKESADGYQP